MTLDELITRLEGAEGPDRWLDAHIHGVHHNQKISVNEGGMVLTDYCVLGWIDPGKEGVNFNPSGIGEKMLRYTESVDAAIALAEKVLPGRSVMMGWRQTSETQPWARVGLWPDPDATGATPAIALCLATLRALKQSEDRTE